MERLNFHHLHHFWVVAREGSLAAAGAQLRLSHSTLSAQIHELEEQLGEPLFSRVGRRLVLTENGRLVLRYADEIFALGRELGEAVRGVASDRPLRLRVGVVQSLPKTVVRRLLQPALELPQPVRLVCHESTFDRLLADLSLHALDVVLADGPLPVGGSVRAFNHLLGETGTTFFATPERARAMAPRFPASLDQAPLLMPAEGLPLRRALDLWLDRQGLRPVVVGEFEDSALMKVFGGDGVGLFAAPTVVEEAICRQYGVAPVGRAAEVQERFYAISGERRLRHPAVVALCDAARGQLSGRS